MGNNEGKLPNGKIQGNGNLFQITVMEGWQGRGVKGQNISGHGKIIPPQGGSGTAPAQGKTGQNPPSDKK